MSSRRVSVVRSGHSLRSLPVVVETLEARRLLAADSAARFEPDPLPRYATKAELEAEPTLRESAEIHPVTPPPTGLITPVSEYDDMEALVLSWIGSSSWQNILGQISRRVTVEGGGRVYIGVTGSGTSTVSAATSVLNTAGANLSRVTFFTVPLNAIWVRDYGPRYVYEGDVRVVADHRYNISTRTLDNDQPVVFTQFKAHQYYKMGIGTTPLRHGGGNYHLASDGDAYATQLITNENPTFTATQVQQLWNTYQGTNTTITAAFPTSVDATQHIDMWMQIYDDKKVFISTWPNNPGSTQQTICDNTAALMQSRGYEVTRLPAYLSGGTHYTFTNMVIFNDVVLFPQYNNGPGATISAQALATAQAAFGPGKQVFTINADALVTAAGVFHCIVQHIPKHRGLPGINGGLAPTAMVRDPQAGQILKPGDTLNVRWISDDDAPSAATGVASVSLQLSTDGGATFPTTIATGLSALGSYNWVVPAGLDTTQARIRAVAVDSAGNTGADATDVNVSIGSNPVVQQSRLTLGGLPQRLQFGFDRNLASSLSAGAISVTREGGGSVPGITLLPFGSDGARTASFAFDAPLPDGRYTATLNASLVRDHIADLPMLSNHTYEFHFFRGDMNNDGVINNLDIAPFVSGLTDADAFERSFGYTPELLGDVNQDGAFNNLDIAPFVAKLTGSRPSDAGVAPVRGGPPMGTVSPDRTVRDAGRLSEGLFGDRSLTVV